MKSNNTDPDYDLIHRSDPPDDPYIDYTLLNADAPLKDYAQLASTAREHQDIVRAVCVPPIFDIVTTCKERLQGSNLGICTVIDYPLGNGGFKKKVEEIMAMLELGIFEFDVVVDLPALRRGDLKTVCQEIKTLQMMTAQIRIKAIIETGHRWYNEPYLKAVSQGLHDAGVWCLKTSTGKYDIETPAGFLPHIYFDDKLRHVHWMHEACPHLKIKVAGGIQSLQEVRDVCGVVPKDQVLIGASKPFWVDVVLD